MPTRSPPAAAANTRDGALNISLVLITGIGETAYTNNGLNVGAIAPITTQYSISGVTSTLFIQNMPNAGTLTVPAVIAPAITDILGFDIASGINVATASAASTGVGVGIIKVAAAATTESIATINLTTGALGVLGNLPFTGSKGFTFNKPAATSVIGLTAAGQLVRFLDTATANTSTPVAITGVRLGDTLVAIDFRPATGQLYALGVEAAGGTFGTLYLLDPQTGAATIVGAPGFFSTPPPTRSTSSPAPTVAWSAQPFRSSSALRRSTSPPWPASTFRRAW